MLEEQPFFIARLGSQMVILCFCERDVWRPFELSILGVGGEILLIHKMGANIEGC